LHRHERDGRWAGVERFLRQGQVNDDDPKCAKIAPELLPEILAATRAWRFFTKSGDNSSSPRESVTQ